MNSHNPTLTHAAIVGGCYGLGFIAAPQLTPLVGSIGAILVAMAGSSVLALAATLVARREASTTLHRRLAELAARELPHAA